MEEIINFLLMSTLIFLLKVGSDLLNYAKADAFMKSNKLYYSFTNLLEAIFLVIGYKIIIESARENYFYFLIFGLGAVISAFVATELKRKLDDKIKGQRKFFTRITIIDQNVLKEILELLKQHNFELAITKNQKFTTGLTHTVITGNIEDRKRMNGLKDLLRNKSGFHVVFIRAEDVFMS